MALTTTQLRRDLARAATRLSIVEMQRLVTAESDWDRWLAEYAAAREAYDNLLASWDLTMHASRLKYIRAVDALALRAESTTPAKEES